MKKFPLLLILFCILISLGLSAQNYQTINSGRINYFTATGSALQFLRIDSISFNGDSIIYPNRCVDQISYEDDYPECFSPYQPSWAGSRIIISDGGENIYFNRENDSIVIKTLAKLNDNWIAYKKRDSILITAEVVAYDTAIVLGLVDSVKTILFQVFDSLGEKLNHPYNDVTVKISKNFGWVISPNFNQFPNWQSEIQFLSQFNSYTLVGIDNPKLGIQNLTWFEVFDFQPGDVLHIKNANIQCGVNDGEYRIKEIKYTYLKRTDYADSIIYLIDHEERETNRVNQVNILTNVHDTIKSVIYDDPEFNILSGEPIINDDGNFLQMNIQSGYGQGNVKYVYQVPMRRYEENCWKMLIFDGGGNSYYMKGLGGDYYEYSGISGCDSYDNTLVYYKKGSETWGTPFYFTGVETVVNTKNVNVYPNPVSDKICVETNSNNDPVTFELYSSGGNLVLHQIIYSSKQDVDMKSFENGIYFYTVSTSDQILKNGKITILH
jgi:hypothetical protein